MGMLNRSSGSVPIEGRVSTITKNTFIGGNGVALGSKNVESWSRANRPVSDSWQTWGGQVQVQGLPCRFHSKLLERVGMFEVDVYQDTTLRVIFSSVSLMYTVSG